MNLIQQAFQVPYSFDIIFTKNLFSTDNQAFNNFLNNFGDTRFQKKILFLIDNGADVFIHIYNRFLFQC